MLANKLKIGDIIGVIAPDKALKTSDKIYLEKATLFFESLGLRVEYGKYLFSDDNYCAGTPQERAQDINDMFSNMPNLNNSILFLEDYHSSISQWNTMLEQFNQSNIINNAVVFDYIYQLQCIENNKHKIEDELTKINSKIPIIKTNDFGHRHPNSIIPIGVDIKIEPTDKSITVLDDYLK